MFKGPFDEYSFKARVTPALIALLPVFIVVAAWLPDLYEFGKATAGLLVSCGAVAILSHFARECGKSIEEKLWCKWGGPPATMALHHKSTLIDSLRKSRFHQFLETRIPGWKAPTFELENKNPEDSFRVYDSAIKWLIERTRDRQKFPLVFAEGVNYGFRRNVLGLKPFGVLVSLVALTISVWFACEKFSVVGIGSIIIIASLLIWWIVVVSESWVRNAANEYAKKLLSSCDLLSE